MSPIIQVKNLSKTFEVKEKVDGFGGFIKSLFFPKFKKVNAVTDISFDVHQGESLAFIGPNGAGKSTSIKALTGILLPTSGTINVLGLDPAIDRMKLAFHIGTVFGQKAQLWYHLPPIDTFYLLYRIYELKWTDFKERLDFLVKAFQIEEYINTPVRKLSLGQRMRCEIVASLLHRPKIIFLDEPTIGLDVVAKQQVRDMLNFLNKEEGVTIFLTSHDAGDIENITNRTIIINHGRIIFDGTTALLKRNFLTTKVIEFAIEQTTDKFKVEVGKIIHQTTHSIKIEIDSQISSIEKLLAYALENFTVTDINIFETPLEEIIAAIYKEPANV